MERFDGGVVGIIPTDVPLLAASAVVGLRVPRAERRPPHRS